MQETWNIPMVWEGQECGRAEIQKQGLYYVFTCRCRQVSDAVTRAVLLCSGKSVPLGVLIPEQGKLCLKKRLSQSQIGSGAFETITLSGPEGEWQPWEGMVFDRAVSGAVSKVEGAYRKVAIPFSPEEPYPYLAFFCCCQPVELHGKLHLMVTIPN